MRKNVAVLRPWLLALCCALMLAGCLSSATQIPYASSAPPEKSCTLNVLGTITVLQFDGKDVSWKAGFGDNWAAVQIPEGSHTFLVDYSRNVTETTQTRAGDITRFGRHYRDAITVRYDRFIAGHTYQMVAAEGAEAGGFSGLFTNPIQAMYDTANNALRIGIRDVTANPDGNFEWLSATVDGKTYP